MRIWPIAACAMLCACAAPRDSFSLTPAPGQQALIREGVPALISAKKNTVFLRPIAPTQQAYGRPRFVIAMLNRGKAPETFTVSSISVESLKPRVASLRVYTHEELTKEVETQRNTQMALAAIGGALGAVSAAQSGYSTTTGSYSYGNRYGTYSQTTYNPALASAAANANAARTADSMASIEDQAQSKLAQLQATIIKDHTLMPGEWHGGVVVIDPPQKTDGGVAEYSISLTFAGERHTFLVKQQTRE